MKSKPAESIELEFFRQLLTSIPEEMGAVLRKTAFSPNIKERRDYSCALYDGRETLAMGITCRCTSARCRRGSACDRGGAVGAW